MEDQSRRKFMAAIGTTAAAGSLTSLAGCSAISDLTGGGGGGSKAYTDWLPVSDSFGRDNHEFEFTDYSSIRSSEGEVDHTGYHSLKDSVEYEWRHLFLRWDDADFELKTGLGIGSDPTIRVLGASLDAERIEQEFDYAEEMSSESSHEDYTVYSWESRNKFIGFKDDTAIETRPTVDEDNETVDAEEVLENAIDRKIARDDNDGEQISAFKTFAEEAGAGTYVDCSTQEETEDEDPDNGEFEGQIAGGECTKVSGSKSKYKRVMVFDSDGDPDKNDIEDWANERSSGKLNRLQEREVAVSENVATITGKLYTDNL